MLEILGRVGTWIMDGICGVSLISGDWLSDGGRGGAMLVPGDLLCKLCWHRKQTGAAFTFPMGMPFARQAIVRQINTAPSIGRVTRCRQVSGMNDPNPVCTGDNTVRIVYAPDTVLIDENVSELCL